MSIAQTVQVCFFQIGRLRRVRRLLGRDVTANLVDAVGWCTHGLITTMRYTRKTVSLVPGALSARYQFCCSLSGCLATC